MVGGDIARVALAGQNFSVASGSDGSLKLGGYKPTARRMGGGETVFTGEQEDWAMAGVDVAIDASSNQLDFLQSTANALEPVSCEVELIDGTVYFGQGLLVDDHSFSTGKSIATLTIMGAGQLAKHGPSGGGLLGLGFLGL